MMPEAFFRIVSFVLLAKLIPTKPRTDSAMFLAAFGRLGRALFPTWHSASIVKFSNLTSTVGSRIPTLSILCLNFCKNLSLSSSATLKSWSMNICLSFTSSLLTSTSLCTIRLLFPAWSSLSMKDFMTAVLSLSYVGSFSMAAHFRASSSSLIELVLLLPENTSSTPQLALLRFLLMLLR
uniref:Uncharacterized protein n=1 Tax=Rhizophora mucronata TaxID=61149 RepID=A0A2P2NKX8_RHIMU